MTATVKISISDIIGNKDAVSTEDGQKVFELISPLLREGTRVELSFDQIDWIISAFLNVAIGQLYGEFSDEDVSERLDVTGLDQMDRELLEKVVDNAKAYFANPDRFNHAWKQETGEDFDDEE